MIEKYFPEIEYFKGKGNKVTSEFSQLTNNGN